MARQKVSGVRGNERLVVSIQSTPVGLWHFEQQFSTISWYHKLLDMPDGTLTLTWSRYRRSRSAAWWWWSGHRRAAVWGRAGWAAEEDTGQRQKRERCQGTSSADTWPHWGQTPRGRSWMLARNRVALKRSQSVPAKSQKAVATVTSGWSPDTYIRY